MIKNKIFISIGIIIISLIIYRLTLPTKIIAVHTNERGYSYGVIINHPPLTDQGMLKWWEDNKVLLRDKYSVPVGKKDYAINFWVSDYKVDSGNDQDSDLYCFEDMKTAANCVEKDNNPLTLWYRHDTQQMVIFLNNSKTTYYKNLATGKIRLADE